MSRRGGGQDTARVENDIGGAGSDDLRSSDIRIEHGAISSQEFVDGVVPLPSGRGPCCSR